MGHERKETLTGRQELGAQPQRMLREPRKVGVRCDQERVCAWGLVWMKSRDGVSEPLAAVICTLALVFMSQAGLFKAAVV